MHQRMAGSNRRGQAQVEYILLIGLVSLFILVALISFRESVIGFLCEVIVAVGGDPIAGCGSQTAPAPVAVPVVPPPAVPAPTQAAANPSPSPAPTPTPASSPALENLAGKWCVFLSSWPGSGFVYTDTFVPVANGTYSNDQKGVVLPTGPDRFEFRSPGGGTEGPYVRQPDGSYQYTNRRPELITLRRC